MIRRHLRRLAAPTLAGALLMASSGAVAAAKPDPIYVLDAFNCVVSDIDGNPLPSNVVPRGSHLLVFEGWIANTKGQLLSFINNVTWVLDVDGQAIDLDPLLSGPIDVGPFWGDFWTYDVGTIARGQTIHTRYDLVLSAASYDGVFHYPAGSLYDGGINCAVSAR